jgi:acyl CoA:acetate/3-ketoacid CoA transferase alpha subunit/acyl CoA:acetate/3-ketoacid CoA transferase beta subunit
MKNDSDSTESREGKLIGLNEAVRRFVGPRMKVHLAGGIGGPSAAICELIRQYRGRSPEFTIIQSTLTGHGLNLVHCGIVKKLVCAVCTDISASARPSRIVQKAYADKTIELENWSLYSLQQRLMAGAFGFPFMPTRSVLGTTIASDNKGSFREMEDPFGTDGKVGIVQALNPDVSIVHGCVADAEGNVILAAPYGEDLWGSLAAKRVIATVEKIVPTQFIRRFAALVKIPSYMVSAVCVAPMGLHPFSIPNPGIDDFEPYEKDVDFLVELSKASKGGSLDAWIDEWIMGCATHRDYLNKLGAARIRSLKERSRAIGGASSSPPLTHSGYTPGDYDPKQMMLIALGREIVKSVVEREHKVVLAGAGAGSTAAFMAYFQLKPKGYEIELLTGNGQVGYTPVPGESILASEAGVRSCKMLSDTIMTQGVFVGGKNNRCLSVLGAGQMDKYGNINSTVTSTGQFLVGSGGANDVLNAQEVIMALDQSNERFVESLPYVTGRGHAVTTVVSTMGVFRKPNPEEELYLVACFADGGATSLEEKIEKVRQYCGWPVKLGPQVEEVPGPSREELQLLQWLISSPGAKSH